MTRLSRYTTDVTISIMMVPVSFFDVRQFLDTNIMIERLTCCCSIHPSSIYYIHLYPFISIHPTERHDNEVVQCLNLLFLLSSHDEFIGIPCSSLRCSSAWSYLWSSGASEHISNRISIINNVNEIFVNME